MLLLSVFEILACPSRDPHSDDFSFLIITLLLISFSLLQIDNTKEVLGWISFKKKMHGVVGLPNNNQPRLTYLDVLVKKKNLSKNALL